MLKYIGIFIAGVLTSFYIFPIEFVFSPTVNTKMMLAVFGVIILIFKICLAQVYLINRDIISVALGALLVSFVGIVSTAYNNTTDYTYASYFVSFAVWTFAAFFVVSCIRVIHRQVSVLILCNYLIAVCVSQCILAILLDVYPVFSTFVNRVVIGFGSMYSAGSGLAEANRLYGIGAALDVAGTRFSVVLAFIGILLYYWHQNDDKKKFAIYFLLFCLLLVIGCMISRTTIVGAGIAVFYWLMEKKNSVWHFWGHIISFFVIAIAIVTYLYYTNDFIYSNMRFAFEFIFNWIEEGTFATTSTDELKSMYKFPENIKTWIIGDGYFNEPSIFDPFYTGGMRHYGLFYMGIDVGYLRFIYYFGIIGMLTFMAYFIGVCRICITRFKLFRWFFLSILISNFIVWFKVATDVYCLLALFLMVSKEENEKSIMKNDNTRSVYE